MDSDDVKNRKVPIIGIPVRYHKTSNTLGVKKAYIDRIISAGGYPILLPYKDNIAEMIISKLVDGLLFIGGEDVSNTLGGSSRITPGYQYCTERDEFEVNLAKYSIKNNIPILGICRGMQILYIATGGKIIYDIEEINNSYIKHRISIMEPSFHDIDIAPSSKLKEICRKTKMHVTSYHHQGVHWDTEQALLWNVAAMSDDGTIEAIEFIGANYIIGVLWHPEMPNEKSTSDDDIINDFVLKIKGDIKCT